MPATSATDTIGIDIGEEAFDHSRSAPARLEVMDAQDLRFPDNYFDLVYSFHALEHIPDPQLALREMARVLKPEGLFVIGTPNKSRLVGYVGSATTLRNKIRWNMQDWSKRLRGQWRNPIAHAGFKEKELLWMCSEAFGGRVQSISEQYYKALYGPRVQEAKGVAKRLYPCVYVLGKKP